MARFLATGSEHKSELVVAGTNFDTIEETRRTWPLDRDRRPDPYQPLAKDV